ncbi:trypsin-like peptidase domain-containing protein [uncultured Tateyamaria sp.]|uniref:trypsin-like peptidase domain-containing protein n=1 Tax=uncultured Tateyamaria sp. TaxID=455651 RepID=UPI002605B552|nr:trypsin-like peptidase domain-containing protein [uncultured Tateyamaria sp.]
MAEHFLTKTQIDLRQCLETGGVLTIEAYPALLEALRSHAGEEAAQLFAEPLLSRGNDQAPPSVSWYTEVQGTAQPFGRLDEAQQAALSAELSRLLRPVREMLDHADDGALVANALNISDPNDVWSVEGVPVIINWGMLPTDLPRDATARSQHYARTLGRFLPLASAPPVSEAERTAWRNRQATAARSEPQEAASGPGVGTAAGVAAGAGVAGVAAGAAVASDTSTADADIPHTTTPPPADNRRVPLWAWLPLVLLLLIAGGTLIWLLIPGNRIFPDMAADRVITDEAALATVTDVNRALEERLATLENALEGAVCVDDGTLMMPDGRTIEGLTPPDPRDASDIPGAVRPATRTAILPPDPERVQVPDSTTAQETSSLLAHIEARTAIVLSPNPDGLSLGTGFFVGPDLLVTNFHVISAPGSEGIYVTNATLGGVKEATVLKTMGPFDSTGGDFALLRVPGADQPAFTLLEPAESLRLQSVIAAGYPGDILQSDAQFQRLRQGDMAAIPELAVTDGTVSAEQNYDDRARVVVHSAPISTGNSGGPLIDMCGRLVGVNTFVKTGAMRSLNFALSSGDLTRFLADTGALPQVVTQNCSPQIQRPIAPEASAALQPEPGAPAPELPRLPALQPKSE